MARHSMVTFQLHRKGVIFIVIGAVLAVVLIFAGGYLLGTWRHKPAAAAAAPVVATAPPKDAGGLKPAAPPPADFLAVRVGVFDSEDDAKALLQQLVARKMEASIVPVNTPAGVKLFTVQVGRYATRTEAAAAAKAMEEEHDLHPAVVPAGGGAIKAPQ